MTDLIDRIDALVDEQMADGEPANGYDFGDPDYPGCPHCHRQWHGLRITKRIESMRWSGEFDPEYSYTEDESPVLCEGSEFIGPRRPPARPVQVVNSFVDVRIIPDFRGLTDHMTRMMERWRAMFQQIAEEFVPAVHATLWMPHMRDGVVFSGRIAFDELNQCAKPGPVPVPEGITVEFGPQNWIHEIRRIPPERQFPRPYWLRNPLDYAVNQHWQQFTAPTFPVPEAHGYDFSRYATNDDDPIWVHRPARHARIHTRPAHTTTRQRRHGRTRR